MFSVWISVNLDEVQCGCKRLRREHSWDVNTDPKAKWDKEKHTRSAYNNAFGQIPDSTAKYLRCDIKTDPKVLSNFMFDIWKIKEPQLIMCIIGGAKYFKLSERLEREFMKGTIRAALKASKLSKIQINYLRSKVCLFVFVQKMVGSSQQVSKPVSSNLLVKLFMIIK